MDFREKNSIPTMLTGLLWSGNKKADAWRGKRSDYGGFMEQGIFPLVWQMSNGPTHAEMRHKIDNWHGLTLSPSLAGDVSESFLRDGSWKGSTVPPWSRATQSLGRHSELPIESLAAPIFSPMSRLRSLSQITAKLSFPSLFSAKTKPRPAVILLAIKKKKF